MRKIMYNRALYLLHKNVKPSNFHDVIVNEIIIIIIIIIIKKTTFNSYPKEN